jgi:hypothetical protein
MAESPNEDRESNPLLDQDSNPRQLRGKLDKRIQLVPPGQRVRYPYIRRLTILKAKSILNQICQLLRLRLFLPYFSCN